MARARSFTRPKRDAGDISHMLAANIVRLAGELLPAGRRDGQEWRCGSVAGEAGKSLGVHLVGPRAGVWADFHTGECGDALGLVAAVLYRGDRGAALAWSRRWLGLADGAAPAPKRAEARPVDTQASDADTAARRRSAASIFLYAQESLAGTPAAEYLRGRGIDLAELGRQPRSLRYHPSLRNRETDRAWPAIVAGVTDYAGEMVAVHRTWLQPRAGGGWGKLQVENPKLSLGKLRGGTIRLLRGSSGKPLAKAPFGETVIVSEGIETGLSCAILCPELRGLCAVSLANMGSVTLPAAIRTVIIAADNDGDNDAAAKGLQRAVDHFARENRIVRLARSPIGKDFNDLLQAAAT